MELQRRRKTHLETVDLGELQQKVRHPLGRFELTQYAHVLGRALYNLIATLDLQRISIGGSVFWHNREYLLPKLQSQVKGKLPALTDGCDLIGAGLEDRVGDYAALALLV